MSTSKITWRPATADDVGRLARFKGSTNSDGFVYDTIVAWNGERFVASSRFAYPRCEVQDVEHSSELSVAHVQSLVRQLVVDMDAKFTRWDVYRTATGDWRLKGEQSAQVCEVTANGFVEAIQQALQWRALPLVPRPRDRLYREGFAAKKHGNKWRMTYLGRDCYVQCNTKKEVESYADRQVALSISAAESWESLYGWSRDKVEGVDFRWDR